MSSVPGYPIRGVRVLGYPDESAFLDDLFGPHGVRTGMLAAVNAEKIVAAGRDPVLRAVLDQADYPYADGISVVRSIRRKYGVDLDRIAGVDLWQSMMARAGREQVKVFLVGAKPRVLQAVREKITDEWGVDVVGSQDGYFGDADRPDLFRRIRDSEAAIVTIAMGSPRQEIFAAQCREIHPEALYMGVGGTFDVVSGQVRRAPLMWRRAGLEWLYRIISQPTRIGRLRRVAAYAGYHFLNRL